jgi:hypothetical protein
MDSFDSEQDYPRTHSKENENECRRWISLKDSLLCQKSCDTEEDRVKTEKSCGNLQVGKGAVDSAGLDFPFSI